MPLMMPATKPWRCVLAEQQLRQDCAVVSDESENLMLVDAQDKCTGYASKRECHDGGGRLHRAFSLFVINSDGYVLMQQRSREKRLWPAYWSNSCCSHPRQGESMSTATQRRLKEELGITCDLKYLFKFCYQAKFGAEGSEYEYCWVYVGRSDDTIQVNRNEIASWCYVKPTTLDRLLSTYPHRFTPWFQIEWQRIMRDHREDLHALNDNPPLPTPVEQIA